MKPENAIEVHDIKKSFKVFLDRSYTLKETVIFSRRRSYELRRVLDGVSFEVKKGEAVGLVGHNGCGKSTTLKMLTRIMYPDEGTIEMRGRVSSLIELGAGFHPDMSGRENIYINASIFGLTRKQIDKRINRIIEFSELEDYIDNPVRTYSSGMYMRLAFAVAINVDADILLIDEILAVGDANFQQKCFDKLREIKSEGTTVVIVSHSLGQIEQFCDRSIWINDGKVEAEGVPREVHMKYLNFMNRERMDRTVYEEMLSLGLKQTEDGQLVADEPGDRSGTDQPVPEEEAVSPAEEEGIREEKNAAVEASEPNTDIASQRDGDGRARYSGVKLLDKDGNENTVIMSGDKCTLVCEYTCREKIINAVFGVSIIRSDGVLSYATNTRLAGFDIFDIDGKNTFDIVFEHLDLIAGNYWIDLSIEYCTGMQIDYYKQAMRFTVVSDTADMGMTRLEMTWKDVVR